MKSVHVRHIDLAQIREELHPQGSNVARPHFALVMNSVPILASPVLHQPMRLAEWRLLRIVAGEADYIVNLVPHRFSAEQFVFLPRNCLVEVKSVSPDYAVQVLAVADAEGLPTALAALPVKPFCLSLSPSDDQLCATYFDLFATHLTQEAPCEVAVAHLALSLLQLMQARQQDFESRAAGSATRGERLVRQFVDLLYIYGTRERNISFYAEQLHITPNHLSTVIRQETGETVMQWLVRTTLTEAKVLLRHSSLRIYEIAHRLAFPEATAFNRYFKAHTGQTPLDYRMGQVR
ncbi:MAG: helix-turn-helix transcriptional regulator [Alloprevotella sp.]|nr:helix-turn-helix transcriptional regulator [Alloprevotella sp.]